MDKIPFTPYDFFAYLSAGSLVVAAVDLLIGERWILEKDVSITAVVFMLLAAYITGHLLAHFSSVVFEQGLATRGLRPPSQILLSAGGRSWKSLLFPGYYRPLPAEIRAKVLRRASDEGISDNREVVFLHAYALTTGRKEIQERLDHFRNLYGFSRNVAFAFFVDAVVIVVGYELARSGAGYGWALASLILGIGMLYRYLKFYRQYCVELFVRYATYSDKQQGSL